MPFCTIVEFEWTEGFGREQFARMIERAGPVDQLPAGCLSRTVGADDTGARVIEVWRSGEDARAFAERYFAARTEATTAECRRGSLPGPID